MKTAALPACLLTLVDRKGKHQFSSSQIIRLEATRSYTTLYFEDRRPFVIAKVLKIYEELLAPYGFVRTHRSHLINSHYIQRVERQTIIMQDESVAEIARNKKTEVRRQLHREGHFRLLRANAKKLT